MWEKGGISRAGFFFYGKENGNNQLGTGFLVRQKRVLGVKGVDFVSDRMTGKVLRGRWCNIIVLNAHTPNNDKSDDSKDSFWEEQEQVFDHFPKYHMKILL